MKKLIISLKTFVSTKKGAKLLLCTSIFSLLFGLCILIAMFLLAVKNTILITTILIICGVLTIPLWFIDKLCDSIFGKISDLKI